MKKDNLKRIIKQFEDLIEELKSEVYSDKQSYVHPWDEHMNLYQSRPRSSTLISKFQTA